MTLKIAIISHMIPSCFKPRNLPAKESKTSRDSRQPSGHHRLAVSDLSDPGGSSSPLSAHDLSSNSIIGSNLHIFTLSELRVITGDFSASNFLGEGGFGPVHKGFIDDKTRFGLEAQPVAVKRLDLEGTQGHMEWLAEVIILAQLKHPHLVKLIGYCWEDEDRLLVYEYMTRGSLENHLFRRYSTCLPWLTRIKIAVGAAKGLAFLHEEEQPVIYRDFKASNILLDSDYNAKLSDFGLAKDGPEGDDTHVTTRIMGTLGYAAPEYMMTGHLTIMSDVYSFGVVLLELITGRQAVDVNRPSREQNLVQWAKPFLKDSHKLERIMDPRLEDQYSSEGAKRVAALAYQCLSHYPKCRPTMSHVVKRLEPVLKLQDIPIGSFVYIAPTQYQKESNNFAKTINDEDKVKEEEFEKWCEDEEKSAKENSNKQRQRHKYKVYSDTTLYRT